MTIEEEVEQERKRKLESPTPAQPKASYKPKCLVCGSPKVERPFIMSVAIGLTGMASILALSMNSSAGLYILVLAGIAAIRNKRFKCGDCGHCWD